ncbi:hypothetical protein VL20_5965 [Microcystis panniformis FACHB-1757]|uniref:Uncharacterized protein n=1 Tax=Microcystis panniformis FACHB-1757 TaxID=1638788 RepID=A0A0K1S9T3_9CHRO|nr:hypothetical protein VL20_5965 [Microcystis panniformis FACHB-1757]
MTRSWQTNKINFLVGVGKWGSGEVGEFQLKPQHPKTLKP